MLVFTRWQKFYCYSDHGLNSYTLVKIVEQVEHVMTLKIVKREKMTKSNRKQANSVCQRCVSKTG